MAPSIFVYGTLKPGLRYRYLAERAGTFSERKAYLDGFDLYHLNPENYPALVRGGGRVYGWRYIYEDIDQALAVLDHLEGLRISPTEYERVEAVSKPGGAAVWIYLYLDHKCLASAEFVRNGVWSPGGAGSGVLPRSLAEKLH